MLLNVAATLAVFFGLAHDIAAGGAIMIACLIGWALIVYDAARACRRQPLQAIRRYQRWYGLVLAVLMVLAINTLTRGLAPEIRQFSTPTEANLPGLRIGDRVVVRSDRPFALMLRRGDLIAFQAGDVDSSSAWWDCPGTG